MSAEWETAKLEDLAELSLGKMLDQKKNRGIYQPYLANVNVRWGSFDFENLSQMKFERDEEERYSLRYGDIVMCEGGEPGRCALWKEQLPGMKIQKALHRIRARSNVNAAYLYYWFLFASNNRLLEPFFTGTTIQHLPSQALKEIKISIPSFDIQRKIASILSALDDKIALNQKINANLQAQAAAVFNKTFPYSIDDDLPPGWRVGQLGEIIEILDAKRIPLSSKQREKMEKTYPYYGAASLMDYVDNYLFDGIYLLLGEDGTVVDDKGHPVLQYVWGKFWVNNHAHILTAKLGHSVESLYLLLSQTEVQSVVTGAVQPKISQTNLKSIKVVIPPKEALIKFNEIIEPFFVYLRNNHDENLRLASIRDALLPKLMSGEIDVSDVELE